MSGHLEVADIFRASGHRWREQRAGHISCAQLKVMSAIERCRGAPLGGHVLLCNECGQLQIAYNSCRNRHCPKCQSSAAKRWLEARRDELLPVEYYHVVFTLPEPLGELAYYNKALMYHLLFQAASETLLIIARDPKHLGARIGMTMVLHTWGSALTHHPHVHCIVPGGGFSADGSQWVACKPGFFLPVRVLSRLFRRLFLEKLRKAYQDGTLKFFGKLQSLIVPQAFDQWCQPMRQKDWYVYTKRPFAGPKAVLQYLSRYTHRVAIANSRLIGFNDNGVTFKWKDYRRKGRNRYQTMTLQTGEFIRRFLIHVLPHGFHRIRHYGLFANTVRASNLSHARELLQVTTSENMDDADDNHSVETTAHSAFICPECKMPMMVIEVLSPNHAPRAPPKVNSV